MHELSRRALLVSVVAASGARAHRAGGRPDRRPAGRGRGAGAVRLPGRRQAGARPRRRALRRARSRRCRTASPISISTPGATSASSPTSRCSARKAANFRLELFHLGHLYKRPVVVNVLRDGIPAPIPYAANLFDYGRNKVDSQPADQPRLRRLPPALSDQRAACLGRGDRVSRRELFPLSRPRPALRPVGARPGDRRRPAAQRGVPVLPRILDRDAGRRRPSTSSSTRCSTANRRPAPSASISCPGQET